MRLTTFFDHAVDISKQEQIPLEEALTRVRQLGVKALEISSFNVETYTEAGLLTLFEAADLRVSSLCAYFSFGDNPNPAPGIAALDCAQRLGAAYILVIPGFYPENCGAEEKETRRNRMKDALLAMGAEVERRNIQMIMEDFDNPNAPFFTSADLKWFLDRIPALGCAFDTGNFLCAEEDELQAFELLKDRINYVHLKDRSLTAPAEGGEKKATVKNRSLYPSPVGMGVIQMSELLRRLQLMGYDGVYTIEHYGAADCWRYLKDSVRWLQAQSLSPAD